MYKIKFRECRRWSIPNLVEMHSAFMYSVWYSYRVIAVKPEGRLRFQITDVQSKGKVHPITCHDGTVED